MYAGNRALPGGRFTVTTVPRKTGETPPALVDRDFRANRQNDLRVSDLTYVATWQGFVDVALVIDVFARRIVGWRVSRSLRSDVTLDALEKATHGRPTPLPKSAVQHQPVARTPSTRAVPVHSPY